MATSSTDVLIVGAGPVGLLLAGQLYRFGVRCRIVDAKEGTTAFSKAMAVHARTLELFDTFDIADEAISRGVIVHGLRLIGSGNNLASLNFDEIDSRYPFLLALEQSETERLLNEYLTQQGGDVE